MRKIYQITYTLLLLSCNKKENKEFYIDRIKTGLTTKEVREILGNPVDSSQYLNHAGEFILRYGYKEENFSDYGFNIIFNDSAVVINYYYD